MTLFEFVQYRESFVERDRQQWNHTSSVMALLVNIHSKRKVKPQDFNPYAGRASAPARALTPDDIKTLLKNAPTVTP